MKRPWIKLIISIVVVFVLTTFLIIFVGGTYGYVALGAKKPSDESRVNNFSQTLANIADDEEMINEQYHYYNDLNLNTITYMLKGKIVNGEYTGTRLFSDGMVIRYDGETLDIPEHEKDLAPTITASNLSDTSPFFDQIIMDGYKQDVIVNIKKIDGDWYYVDWSSTDDLEALNFTNSDVNSIMSSIEEANDCYLVVFDDERVVRYYSYVLEDSLAEDKELKFTEDYFKNHLYYSIDGVTYSLDYLRIPDTNWEIYSLNSTSSTVSEGTDWANLFFIVTILFTITMIIWNYAVQMLVKKHILSKEQEEKYNPGHVRLINIIAGIIIVILVFVTSLLFYGTLSLRSDITRGKTMLYSLKTGLEEDKFRKSFATMDTENWFVYYADKIAELSAEYDNHPSHEMMANINEIIGSAQYIILYDEKGNEIVSSNDFVDFSLGTDSKDPTTDFRRILKGIDHIVHDSAHDDFTGLDSQLIAVRMKMKDSGRYGVLVMSLYPYVLETSSYDMIYKRVNSMTSGKDVIFGFDKENGEATFCNNDDYRFLYATDFGIDLAKRLDNQMNVYKIEGNKYYGQSIVDTDLGYTFYYLVKDSFSLRQGLEICLMITLYFLIVYVIGIFIITRGYTQKFFEDHFLEGDPIINGRTIKIMLADGRKKRTTDISERFSLVPHFWSNMLPEQKAELAFNLLLIYFIFSTAFVTSTDLYSQNDYLINYVMQGDWTRGFNLLALFAIVILLSVCLIGLIIARNIMTLLCLMLDTKGETICRLAFNLLQYVVFIAFLYYAFGYLGFNTAGILASVGFVTLAVSIGSRDLVADVLAGLMIVFEGEYQIGDMIEVGGYRGQVQEIGIRSTKVVGRGNNVKIIGNRDVKNVINMTRMNSWIPIEIKVSSDQSLPEIEKMLDEELPKIGKANPKILGGPYYYGVLGFDRGSVRLSIMTECREEDYYNVERSLYKSLYELFKQQNVMIG